MLNLFAGQGGIDFRDCRIGVTFTANFFQDGARRYGARAFSPDIIRRLEDACGVRVLGEGFPEQMVDDEPKVPGYEVAVRRGAGQ